MTRPSLADCADLIVGDVTVRPSICEVAGPTGREAVEPRVMEVLLALIGAQGAVLSRDALVAACWGGRAVSEDAITRVISKIRRLSEGIAAGAFSIETLPKIGYRLLAFPASADAGGRRDLRPPQRANDRLGRRRTWMALGALLVVLGGAGAWAWRERVAAARPEPVRTARPAQTPAEFAAADLEVRGRAAVFEGTPAQLDRGIGYLREATARAPRDADAWGALAMAQVLSLRTTAPTERAAVTLRIREAATRALALDPHEGLALAAQVSLEPTFGAWSHKDEALRRALQLAPTDTPAVLVQRAQFLAAVGRMREATALMERAAAAAPLLPWIQAGRVQLLADSQQLDAAECVAARAASLWPRDPQLWRARFWLKIDSGRTSEALAMATDPALWPDSALAADMAMAAHLADAVRSRSPAAGDAVLAAYRGAMERRAPDAPGQAMRAALALGRPQAALALAERLFAGPGSPDAAGALIGPQRPGERDTAPLFSAAARPLWSDARFTSLMQASGLAAYWRATRKPDFCREIVLAAPCSD
ncbi:winged helix-turn-helix domain-containing protein [Phenylobacterium sp.]|uniref:winged helix-turn-helix domain-containing protein n=1 Tax=Phenylobacterium sp. TaxID=1871053 RepID=UPI0025F63EBA|nr:winged helix-turn-helix domain-containing protein [Phenylobacterium sp.]